MDERVTRFEPQTTPNDSTTTALRNFCMRIAVRPSGACRLTDKHVQHQIHGYQIPAAKQCKSPSLVTTVAVEIRVVVLASRVFQHVIVHVGIPSLSGRSCSQGQHRIAPVAMVGVTAGSIVTRLRHAEGLDVCKCECREEDGPQAEDFTDGSETRAGHRYRAGSARRADSKPSSILTWMYGTTGSNRRSAESAWCIRG